MIDEKFKEAEKINKNIEQIKDELSLLKKSEYCCIKLYSDTGSHAKVDELHFYACDCSLYFCF